MSRQWRETPEGRENYIATRRAAQAAANADGFDRGVEANDVFHTYCFSLLPGKQHRFGHELRCEVVMCMYIDRVQPGHMTTRLDFHLPYVYQMTPWTSDQVLPARRWARVLSVLAAYEYQACEAPEWESSVAQRECDRLRRLCCLELRNLLGAGDLWDVNEGSRDVFVTSGSVS